MTRQLTESEIKTPTQLKLTQAVFVREHGAEETKSFKAGKIVTVSGIDKLELMARGIGVELDESESTKQDAVK